MRHVKVTYSDGTVINTSMAAHLTDSEILAYFKVGKQFNIGNVADNMQTVVGCDIIPLMTKEELIKRFDNHKKAFELLWGDVVEDIIQYREDNQDEDEIPYFHNTVMSRLVDSLCLSGAWIHDRLNGKSGTPGRADYRGSKTKAIRKALGYNI